MTEESTSNQSRLGKCEVCDFNLARYTCPKCEVKTCCLKCLLIHKTELNCSGIRDKTKYIPMKQIDESTLMGDYIFLENCTQYTYARKQDKMMQFTAQNANKGLPKRLNRLKKVASERNINLRFLLQNFRKHKINKTCYDWTSNVIYWHIEWHFLNINKKFADHRCSENSTMINLLEKYFDVHDVNYSALEYYKARGISNMCILLKAEGIHNAKKRFYRMNPLEMLKNNLRNKIIIEYPEIYIVYETDCDDFDIIDTDEEDVIIRETQQHTSQYFSTLKPKQSHSVNNVKMDDECRNLLFSTETDATLENMSDDNF